MNNLIKKLYALKIKKEALEAQTADLETQITDLDTNITELSKQLLEQMKTANARELEVEDIKAGYFKRENIGYTNDADVLNCLKEKYNSNYIKTKTTESIDKTALKKAIKSDEALAKDLEALTIKTISEYVVVTSKDNYQAMLEHIEKGKSK